MVTSIPPGTLVLKSPCYSHIISPHSMSNVCDSCLASPNIFDHLPPVSLYRCSRCKLSYYCNMTCQRDGWSDHSKECKYLKKIQPRVPPAIVRLILRTCQKHKKEPDLNEKLPDGSIRSFKDLEMHKEDISNNIDKKEAFSSFLQVIQACVGDLFTADHLFETYCRVLINSTEITDCMGNSVGTGLYLGLSAVDHSCVPNVNVVFTNTEVELRALETISAPVFGNTRVSYNNSVLPIKLRQDRLKEDYFFLCSCELCSNREFDLFCEGSTLCEACKGPVGATQDSCSGCGKGQEVDVSKEKGIFFESLENDQLMKAYNILRTKFHIYDYRMLEFSEKAMAVCLIEENFEKFYQIGESLLPAYKKYFSPNSTSLGLHLAKLAKSAIYLNKTEEGISYLKQCFEIFKLSHGEDSKLYQYLITLRDTI
eukprot:GFUD01024797.1.p1 GENE.GFUD01024797.1~~GFUD01024797.1.p1  ORF type:complete len:425 (+),score=95.45 GFUD01024797.1:73-1347(+)